VIDPTEMRHLLVSVGEDLPEEKFQELLHQIDTDSSGAVNFKEFAVAMKRFLQNNKESPSKSDGNLSMLTINKNKGQQKIDEADEQKEGEDEEEEEEEIPEDLASLPADKQKVRILWRAIWMMGLGTIVVLLFSDPMVDVLDELGNRFNINPFYVAFVLAPLASNASELIASINYATKKTKKTITISLGALEGAACMNNTFCLAIFLCLIFFKGLAWEFSAETISIIFVELVLFGFTLKKTHRLFDAILILSLYPFSIFLVWIIENKGGLN